MTREECDRLVSAYSTWLRNGLSIAQISDDVCEVTTPFLDRHNDSLQIYAQRVDGRIRLSDDGYILSDLISGGVDLRSSSKRQDFLRSTLNGFGVRLADGELTIEATEANLGQRLHSLIQAMLSVDDMYMMAQSRVASFFADDVRAFLEESRIRYSPQIKITGRSGFDHAIDFIVPASPERQRPERFIQVISSPQKDTTMVYLFALSDVREGRGQGAEAYAFLNDRDHTVSGDVVEALDSYNVVPVRWSQRNQVVERLAS